jgi:hypothetical protein
MNDPFDETNFAKDRTGEPDVFIDLDHPVRSERWGKLKQRRHGLNSSEWKGLYACLGLSRQSILTMRQLGSLKGGKNGC